MNNKPNKLNNFKKLFPTLLSQNKSKRKNSEQNLPGSSLSEDFDPLYNELNPPSNRQEKSNRERIDKDNSTKIESDNLNSQIKAPKDVRKNESFKKTNVNISNNLTECNLSQKKLREKSTSSSSSTLVSDAEPEKRFSKKKDVYVIEISGPSSLPSENYNVHPNVAEINSGRTSAPLFQRKDRSSPVVYRKKKVLAPRSSYSGSNYSTNKAASLGSNSTTSTIKSCNEKSNQFMPASPNEVSNTPEIYGKLKKKDNVNSSLSNAPTVHYPIVLNPMTSNYKENFAPKGAYISQGTSIYNNVDVPPFSHSERIYIAKAQSESDYQSIKNQESFNVQNRNTSTPVSSNTSINNNNNSDDKIPIKPGLSRNNNINPSAIQKIRNLQNVEAFYWQQIKKIKQTQDSELFKQTMSINNLTMDADMRNMEKNKLLKLEHTRCRSVSPAFAKSFDYNVQPQQTRNQLATSVNNNVYGNIRLHNNSNSNYDYNPNFVRGSHLRNTIGSTDMSMNRNFKNKPRMPMSPIENSKGKELYKKYVDSSTQNKADYKTYQNVRNLGPKIYERPPIFKRGSLVIDATQTQSFREKKVSFSKPEMSNNHAANMELFSPSSLMDDPSTYDSKIGKMHPNSSSENVYGEIRKSYNTYGYIQNRAQMAAMQIKPKALNGNKVQQNNYILPQQRVKVLNQYENRIIAKPFIPIRQDIKCSVGSESESGSEAGEVRRIMLGHSAESTPTHMIRVQSESLKWLFIFPLLSTYFIFRTSSNKKFPF